MSDDKKQYVVVESNKKLDFSLFKKFSKIFIETGSGRLDGVFAAIEAGFSEIRTVEASRSYYDLNVTTLFARGYHEVGSGTPKRRQFVKNHVLIYLYFGMSKDCLPMMLNDLEYPAVLWLDAHVSGPQSAGHDDFTKKGGASEYAQHNVLLAELGIVIRNRKDHIILIDDQNGMTDECQQYIKLIHDTNNNYTFTFYDEQRGSSFYKNKSLACIT